jgi:outer membrane protein OmpA-like peptidoglycan-associated protein
MSRSPELRLTAAAAVAVTLAVGVAVPAAADDPGAQVLPITAQVLDIATTVESIDGTEAEEQTETARTVILTSDVLFPEDSAALTARARARLAALAAQVRAAGVTGTLQVNGYTDDQGSAAYGLTLSRRRADAVRAVLAPALPGIPVVTRGYGEADPRVPNIVGGRPSEANRAKNRRVEITYAPRR